jgi:hypothetical protein
VGDYQEQTTWTNHYDGPIRNTKQQLDHIYYNPFASHGNVRNYAEPKPFS